tara:strand:+ start:93 stop:734 length:642 start_codon:yes stop_codon:yes gene_type:complete
MIRKEDINRAINLFKCWDNERKWEIPSETFKHHTLKKAENSLQTAQFILQIMEDQKTKELFNAEDYNGTLWIINSSYYYIFFFAQYLLAFDNKKLPKNIQDTHKTVELALLYYFIIKGSNLENKKDLYWEDIQHSRLSQALELLTEAKEENQELTQQRAKKIVENIGAERTKRHEFTYAMTIDAELNKAKTSISRAIEFGDVVKEYIKAKSLV